MKHTVFHTGKLPEIGWIKERSGRVELFEKKSGDVTGRTSISGRAKHRDELYRRTQRVQQAYTKGASASAANSPPFLFSDSVAR